MRDQRLKMTVNKQQKVEPCQSRVKQSDLGATHADSAHKAVSFEEHEHSDSSHGAKSCGPSQRAVAEGHRGFWRIISWSERRKVGRSIWGVVRPQAPSPHPRTIFTPTHRRSTLSPSLNRELHVIRCLSLHVSYVCLPVAETWCRGRRSTADGHAACWQSLRVPSYKVGNP